MPRAKIKPCPCCGMQPCLNNLNNKWYYYCPNLDCPGNVTTDAYLNKGLATRAWNKRYTKDVEVAIAKKIFADIEGQVVTKATYHGEVIWESAIKINDLKKKYGVIE